MRKSAISAEIPVEFSGGYSQQLRVGAGPTWAGVDGINHPQCLGFAIDGVDAYPGGSEALGAQCVEFRQGFGVQVFDVAAGVAAGGVNVDDYDGGTLRVGQYRVLASFEFVAIGSIKLRSSLSSVRVFDPSVFEVAISAGMQGFAAKMAEECLGV